MTIAASQVRIGPEFFAKIHNDYANWRWAIIREFAQNSIDAKGCDKLEFTIESDGTTTTLTVKNNGEPMTHEIITTKLLTLGGSGKNFAGTVGGFGVAKSLLYYCNKQYLIHTGDIIVRGEGASYTIEDGEYLDGTTSVIEIEGDHSDNLRGQVKRLAALTRWKGAITLNGEELETHRYRGTYRRSFSWGDVYTNKTAENQLVVRINGVPMFTKHCLLNRQVILELNGQSSEVLQSSRDSMTYKVQDEFDIFIQELAVDRRSALTQHNIERHLWDGESLAYRPSVNAIKGIIESVSNKETTENGYTEKLENGYTEVVSDSAGEGNSLKVGGMTGTVVREEKIKASPLGYKFLIENSTGMTIPDYYLPGYLSSYSTKLVKNWAAVLLEIYEVFGDTSPFNVGFILDKDGTEAAYCKQEGHSYYLISPAKVVEQLYSRSRSFKNRWNFTPRGKWQIVMTALHEYVHKLGYSQHDEDYANVLTDKAAVIVQYRDRFNKCFR